jgi:fluoride exporter
VTGVWVALGGGLGAVARFVIAGWVTTWSHAGFPWGTLAVNLLGSAAFGFFHRSLPPPTPHTAPRAFLIIGFCGGFTTFGTVGFETLTLLHAGRGATGVLYVLGSVAACVAGVVAGAWAAGARSPFTGPPPVAGRSARLTAPP